MPGFRLASALGLLLLAPSFAAAAECTPFCDYNHYYGAADLTYARPGLFCYPVCDARGNCAPSPVCVNVGPGRDCGPADSGCVYAEPSRGRVIVRSLSAPAR
ncbi:MAG TPA: hypothetical protein VHA77_15050 [Xanthobacteraceae bacterium]|nr:hypothetical protein [Xanthobacteraceae bacterium]